MTDGFVEFLSLNAVSNVKLAVNYRRTQPEAPNNKLESLVLKLGVVVSTIVFGYSSRVRLMK